MPDESGQAVERAVAKVVSDINGVSDRVINNLDDEFGTTDAVATASVSELKEIEGIGPTLARRICRRTNTARRNPDLDFEYIYDGR